MLQTWRIRKGDKVVVISGKNKGNSGEISQVFREESRVCIKGLNLITRHEKPSSRGPGGLVRKEAPIHVSNVMLVDPKSGVRTRIGTKIVDGKKIRYAKRSGEIIV